MATQMVNNAGLIAMQIKCWVLPVAPGSAMQLLHGQQRVVCINHSTNAMQGACNTGAAASVTVTGMLTNALAVHLQHGKQAAGPCVSHSTTAAQLDATMTDLCLLQALDVDGCCGSVSTAWQASSSTVCHSPRVIQMLLITLHVLQA